MALLVVKLIGHAYCIIPRISQAVNAAAMASNLEYTPHSCRLYRERITRIISTRIAPSYVACHTLKRGAMMRVYGSTRLICRWRKVQSISYLLLCTSRIRVDPPHQTSGANVVHIALRMIHMDVRFT
jgi:hypothetical protein